MPDSPPIVVAHGLRKAYAGFEAVRGVDFQCPPGECFGFLGPNGAGKTSTMKTLYGACVPTSGELRIFGLEARTQMRAIKRRLGVVPQEDNLDTDLTVRENLTVFARYFRLPAAEAARRADELLEFFQLAEKAGVTVEKLSGGMKRRLLTARALIGRPELLILDEPTTGLDPQARHLLWEKLRELRRQGVSLLLTTHYMDEAERLCDRLVIMDGGRIIEEGNPRELIARRIGRQVLELDLPDEGREERRVEARTKALAQAGEGVTGHQVVGSGLLLFTPDAEALLHRLRSAGVPIEGARLRSATLEDVFLQVAGRRLID
ncbi:MAG: ABC transporter ATP-binding protein [Planctomycetes bacterium]|nr:ABC transporter ATP-binding protein [Planctomycetota bacterium]